METEVQVREATKAMLIEWLRRDSSYDAIYGPEITHGKGNLSTILTKERASNEKLQAAWNRIHDKVRGWEIQPDVVALVEKNNVLQWIVAECKIGYIDVSALSQILLYATVLRAHKALLGVHGHVKPSVTTLYDNNLVKYVGTNIYGVEKNMHIGIYIYNPVTKTFRPELPPHGII